MKGLVKQLALVCLFCTFTEVVFAANELALPEPQLPATEILPAPSITAALTGQNSSKATSQQLTAELNSTIAELQQSSLPKPLVTSRKPLYLSMQEAILLTLRNNPDVLNDELDRVTQKFALIEEHWQQWEPQYSLAGSFNLPRGGQLSSALTSAGVSVNTPIGTSITAGYTNTDLFGHDGTGSTAVTVTQHLLRGFGWAVNTANWYDDLDAEEINKLNFKANIISAVVSVIQNYRQLVENYNQLAIDKKQLKISKETLNEAQLKLQAGQLSKSDYVQQEAQYKTQQVQYIEEQASVYTAYAALLRNLGLNSDAKIVIDKKIIVEKRIIPLKKAIRIALVGNIDYQTSLINLRSTERALIVAKNQALWQLDAAYTTAVGTGAATPEFALNWSIPINDKSLEQGILVAQINLEKARISLAQKKQDIVRDITTQIINLHNALQAIQIAQEQVKLQQQTVNNIRLKIKYGQSTVFELNTEQQNLIQYQNSLVQDQISYMNDLTNLYQKLGITLDIRHIKLRY